MSKASVAAGSVTEVQISGKAGIPADASAVAINLAAVSPAGPGFVSAYPCGSSRGSASTLNYEAGAVTSNSAIVKIGANGRICLYSLTATDLLVDITGWFPAAADFTAISPDRALDTRSSQRRPANSVLEVQVTGRAGIPANASAVALNVAAVNPAGPGYLTAYPCGSALPATSTVNHDGSPATSNSTIVKVGTGGKVCFYNLVATDIIADITGWFPAGSDFTAVTPNRVLDTRTTQRRPANSTLEVQVAGRAGIPSDASAVAINLAAVSPAGPGYISAFPCGSGAPSTSTVNHDASPATSNSTVVKVGTGGKVCFYNLVATDIIADVTGWFAASSDFTAVTPSRALDTRTAQPGPSGPPVPGSAKFVATFDGNTGLDQFDYGLWHRDPYLIATSQWTGDHDLNCGSPDTQRPVHRSSPNESFYLCKDHLMTSVGDTSGYSIAWFAPKASFNAVNEVRFSVNLTDLNDRKWWKVGVVSTSRYNSTYNGSCCGPAPGFLVSDVGSADLPTSLDTSELFLATWSGGASAGYPGCLKIGNNKVGTCVNPAPNDKATRFPVSLVDNHNGTVTFTVAGTSATASGSFPECPCRVVFYDHNYTPDKDGVPIGHTWHWDDIVVL